MRNKVNPHLSVVVIVLICSCDDEKRAGEVKGASERITAMSAELIGCANRVAQEEEETSAQQLEDLQDTLENTELLRRDWASQVCVHNIFIII